MNRRSFLRHGPTIGLIGLAGLIAAPSPTQAHAGGVYRQRRYPASGNPEDAYPARKEGLLIFYRFHSHPTLPDGVWTVLEGPSKRQWVQVA